MSTLISQIDNAERRFSKSKSQRDLALAELSKIPEGEAPNWKHLDKRSRYKTRLERLGCYSEADAIMDDQPISFSPLERILDASELSSVEFFERGVIAARTVARVQIRNATGLVIGHGSGVTIGPGLFMTNNHVLSTAQIASSSTVQFDYLSGIAGAREPLTFSLDPEKFFVSDESLDFTVVALSEVNDSNHSSVDRGWSPLIANSGKATVGERVNIIQHPGGERMQVVLRDNMVIGVVDSFMHYRADTKPGSSGSPVFNDQWELAALHHAGKPKRNAQGKILMVNGQPWTGNKADIPKIDWEANEGIRISEIVRFVNQLSLTDQRRRLWDQTQMPAPIEDLWSLFERLDGNTATGNIHRATSGLDPVSETVDEAGNPAWLFRLSFGPVTSGQMSPTLALPKSKPSSQPLSTQYPTSVTASSPLDPMSAAQKIVERFQSDGPYYDQAADTAARDEYWNGVDLTLPSADLFPILRKHLEGTHSGRHSYSRARHEFLYPVIDLHPDGNLRNVYSGEKFSPVEAIAAEIEALTPFSEAIGLDIDHESIDSLISNEALWDDLERSAELSFNCEHVVCQSWFDKLQPMKADIHHLFACQPGCNSFRNNIPYWQFDPTDEAIREACGRTEGRSKFEPEYGKGAVARATMYFLMRYPGLIGDDVGEFTKSRVKILTDWHAEFPADEYEKHRNHYTEKAQGNRNPFIDFPDIATQALLEYGFG